MSQGSRTSRSFIPRQHLDEFCSEIAEGLHAIAQPLTIIRNELIPGRVDHLSEKDLRQTVRSSALEIERICSFFHLLKEIVAIERFVPDMERVSAANLVTEAYESVDRIFQKHKLSLELDPIEVSWNLKANRKRALQSLSMSLLAFCTLSRPGQQIMISSRQDSRYLSIVIRNDALVLKHVDAQDRLVFSLIRSNLRGHGGQLVYGLMPLTIELRFKRDSVATEAEEL